MTLHFTTKPYSGISDPDLPDRVQKLSASDRRQWVAAFNNSFEEDEDEGKATRIANAAVKEKQEAEGISDAEKASKTEGGQQFGPDDYADIGDPDKPSTWKLRLSSSPGKRDAGYISRAITAMQPGGYRGNRVELGSSKSKVVRKISAAISSLDDAAQKKNLRGRLNAVKEKVVDEPEIQEKMKELAEAHGHAVTEKCHECESAIAYYRPYGGAVSFDQMDAYQETVDMQMTLSTISYQFQSLQENIFSDDELSAEEKADALVALGTEFQARVRTMSTKERGGGLMDRVRGWLRGPGEEGATQEHGLMVFKDKAGRPRWVSFSSNNFEDHSREVIKEKTIENAIAYGDLTGERGPLRLWHIPGADIGVCDFQTGHGGFLVESGTFLDNDLGRAAFDYFSKSKADHHVSLGFMHFAGDELDGNYEWIQIKERSVLPAGRADNPFTSFSIGGIPEMEITKDKKDWLESVVGPERATEVLKEAEERTKALQEAGIRHKEKDGGEGGGAAAAVADPPATAPAAQATEAAPAAQATVEGGEQKPEDTQAPAAQGGTEAEKEKEAAVGFIVNAVKEAMAPSLKGIEDAIADMDTRLKAVEQTDDQKIADQMAPRRTAPGEITRPTDRTDNEPTADGMKAIEERNKAGEGDEKPGNDPVSPYVGDLLGHLGLKEPAGAAAS